MPAPRAPVTWPPAAGSGKFVESVSLTLTNEMLLPRTACQSLTWLWWLTSMPKMVMVSPALSDSDGCRGGYTRRRWDGDRLGHAARRRPGRGSTPVDGEQDDHHRDHGDARGRHRQYRADRPPCDRRAARHHGPHR